MILRLIKSLIVFFIWQIIRTAITLIISIAVLAGLIILATYLLTTIAPHAIQGYVGGADAGISKLIDMLNAIEGFLGK